MKKKNYKVFSLVLLLSFVLLSGSTVYATSAGAYTNGGVNVRDRYTNQVVGTFAMGKYIYGSYDSTFMYFNYNGKPAKIYKSVLTFGGPSNHYVIADSVNVRDDKLQVVGKKRIGDTLKAVRIGNYYRFWENGAKFIFHNLVSSSPITGVYTLAKTPVYLENGLTANGYISMGTFVRAVEKADGYYFFFNGKPSKISLTSAKKDAPKTRYVIATANVRDSDLKVVGSKKYGQKISSVLIGNYYRFYENGNKFIHKSLVSDTLPAEKPEVSIPETKVNPTLSVGQEIKTLTAINGFENAVNAANRTSPKTLLEAGNYFVYKIYNGTPNISRFKGQPGSWVNKTDLYKAMASSTSIDTIVKPVEPTPTPKPLPVPSPVSPEPIGTGGIAERQFQALRPLGFMATAVKSDVVLSWEPVYGADGYDVYEAVEPSMDFVLVGSTREDKLLLRNKESGKTYIYYTVAKKDFSGQTVMSQMSSLNTATVAVNSLSTIRNFLDNGLGPMGSTMYIWGGGWTQYSPKKIDYASMIGVHEEWREFYLKQGPNYNFKNYYYKRELGLDCSGYVGFINYNTFRTSDNQGRIIAVSGKTGDNLTSHGLGTYQNTTYYKTYQAGDIMFKDGHVFVVLGQCPDQSLVVLHSSIYGVKIGSTTNRNGSYANQANALAKEYMSKYFPDYYSIDSKVNTGRDYLTNYKKFTFNKQSLSDPDGYRNMTAEQILKDLFKYR